MSYLMWIWINRRTLIPSKFVVKFACQYFIELVESDQKNWLVQFKTNKSKHTRICGNIEKSSHTWMQLL